MELGKLKTISVNISLAVKSKKPYVYTLAYPNAMGGHVFYVGKGKRYRIHEHDNEASGKIKEHNPYKCRVIRKIWAAGEQVVKTILACFETDEEACLYEIALVFLMDGLTNLTDGGEGKSGWVPSEETRQKIRQVLREKKPMEETRCKPRKSAKRRIVSEATRQKMREANEGKTLSEEHKRKIGKANKLRKVKPFSKKTRRKMSEAQTRRYVRERDMSA